MPAPDHRDVKVLTTAGYYRLKDMNRKTLRRLKIRVAGAAIAGILVLTGCSTPESQNITSEISSSPSESTQSGNSDNSNLIYSTSDGRTPAEGKIDQSGSILTVPKSLFTETIVERRADEFGEYAVTKISYPSIDSVDNKGVSKADLVSALEYYTDFLSTEVLDSIALDNYSNYDKWVAEVAPKYIAPDYFDEVVNAQKHGKDAGVVFNNYSTLFKTKNVIPVGLRDGGPRLLNKHIWGIKAESMDGGIYIWSMGAATLLVDDKSGADWWDALFGSGGSQQEWYNDNKLQASQISFQVGLTLIPDGDSWKIRGYSNSLSINGAEDNLETPQKFIDWRNSIK